MSPSFIAEIAFAAGSPTQSSAKATGFFTTLESASATGFSESLASRPLGRPKCASRMTLPPLVAISVMVGATRSSRVASVTRPFSMGTLRSTRSSTRLPFTSTSSRVRKDFVIWESLVPGALRHEVPLCRTGTYLHGSRLCGAPLRAATHVRDTREELQQLAHRHGRVGHAVGKTPLVVVPGHHAHEVA